MKKAISWISIYVITSIGVFTAWPAFTNGEYVYALWLMFAIFATVLFLLAAFGVDNFGDVGVVELGLAAVAMHLLVGNWLIGSFVTSRNPN